MKDEEMAEEIANKRCHEIMCYGHCGFNSPKHHRCGGWHREYNCALAGLKAGRPQWHDLRENPNDLPKESVIEGLSERVIGTTEIAKNQYMSQECRYDFVDKIWKTHKDPYVTDVIAWCEIPTYEEVKQ